MPAITFDKWDAGLDVRKSASTADANRLRVLTNAYVTTGYQIRKRPGFRKVVTLESGTKGLRPIGGKLNTFYGTGSVSHADPLFVPNKVPDASGLLDVAKVHYADVFAGYTYAAIEYTDGSVAHHYLDGATTTWNPSDKSGNIALSNGNRDATRGAAAAAWATVRGTRSHSSGKWYFEVNVVANGSGGFRPMIGVADSALLLSQYVGYIANSWSYWTTTAPASFKYNNAISAAYGATFTAGDTIGVLVDFDAGTIEFYKNNVAQGVAYTTTLLGKNLFPAVSLYSSGAQARINIMPGDLTYAVPVGFTAWGEGGSLITDGNCPNTPEVTKQAESMWAVGPDADVVRYSATAAARDWTSSGDAGFLATARQQSGATEATALGEYQKNLVVFFPDGIQIWLVDPTPTNISLTQKIPNIGTPYRRSHWPLYGDLVFLSLGGFRSVTMAATFENMREDDIGSPIDNLIKDTLDGTEDPISFFYPKDGQWWCIIGTTAWVYTYSRVSKVAAWSKYTLPFTATDVAVLDSELYLRSGDDVYIADHSEYQDLGGTFIPVEMIMPYVTMKAPGALKQLWGADAISTGTPELSFRFDPREELLETQPVPMVGDTPPGYLTPVECVAEKIAPVIRHEANEPFELNSITLYYETLGVL